jgi:branched-chain amino acid transport system ATP-binding protein
MTGPLLEVEGVATYYGRSQVLFGVSLEIGYGEVATLMGRNGMGKTTTVRSIMGLTPPQAGSIRMIGRELRGLPPYRVARAGLGLVPEGRQVFPNLTVAEHLTIAHSNRAMRPDPWTPARILTQFPGLRERARQLGGKLSGGEQQMLAIGRALVTNPMLLIFDEATEGLAPLIREEIWSCIKSLKSAGQAILVIDKNVDALTGIADRHHIIEKGRIVWIGSSDALRGDNELQRRYLGV